MQIYTLKQAGLNNPLLIEKKLATYGIYECLDLTRELNSLEESELKDELMCSIILYLETRLKTLLFG